MHLGRVPHPHPGKSTTDKQQDTVRALQLLQGRGIVICSDGPNAGPRSNGILLVCDCCTLIYYCREQQRESPAILATVSVDQ